VFCSSPSASVWCSPTVWSSHLFPKVETWHHLWHPSHCEACAPCWRHSSPYPPTGSQSKVNPHEVLESSMPIHRGCVSQTSEQSCSSRISPGHTYRRCELMPPPWPS
jgi:hypothetical protein